MNPWSISILAKTKASAEKHLKNELAKKTDKHVELMTPLRVWLGLMPEMDQHVYRIECRGWINGKGAKIEALIELERLHE